MNTIKLESALGEDTIKELQAKSADELKSRLAEAHQAIRTAKEELSVSPSYQEAKENVKALSAGYRELRKRQQQISDYCLYLLEQQGK